MELLKVYNAHGNVWLFVVELDMFLSSITEDDICSPQHPSIHSAISRLLHIPDLIHVKVSLCAPAIHHGGDQLDLSTRRCITNTLPDTCLHTSRYFFIYFTFFSASRPATFRPQCDFHSVSPNLSCFSLELNEVVEMHFLWWPLYWRISHPRISPSIPEFLIKHMMVRGNDLGSN